MNIFVSLVTAILVIAFVVFTIATPRVAAEFFEGINDFLNVNFNWLYIGTVNATFLFLIYMGMSKFGKIRLGSYTSKPEFSDIAWFSMMFSAGIGIGILFYGVAGDLIDTVATLSVLFGLATSLGLGAQQINSGLNYVFGIPYSTTVQLVLIVCITFVATLSVVSGVSRGIKWLSEINIVVSGLLLFGILLIGPTTYILSTYLTGMGEYIRDLFSASLFTATKASDIAWQGDWTVFYWAWWISWAPFVGTFIARISKGRTIKQIAFGVLVIPTLAITFAMTILGASGIYVNQLFDGVITKAVDANVATSMFEMYNFLTTSGLLQGFLSLVSVVAIIIFFVTSSDSGSLVVSSLTSGGRTTPPKAQRIFWAVMEGAIALSVLLVGGEAALNTIQSAIVILGFPFAIIFIIMMLSLGKELKESYKKYMFNKNVSLKRRLKRIDDHTKYR